MRSLRRFNSTWELLCWQCSLTIWWMYASARLGHKTKRHQRSCRQSDLHKGADYHEVFSLLPHLALVWSLERKLLMRIERKQFFASPSSHLDLSYGNRRILVPLALFSASTNDVDVSASILQIARDTLAGVELVEADITRNHCLGNRQFYLIKAIRFFPRAGPQLRREAITVIARHLRLGGMVVFNNHLDRHSLVR